MSGCFFNMAINKALSGILKNVRLLQSKNKGDWIHENYSRYYCGRPW